MSNLKIKLVDNIEEFEALKPQWDKLLIKSEAHALFCSWDWLYLWWTTYATRYDQLCILTISDGGSLSAIAPFYIKQYSLLSELRFIGTGEKKTDEVCSECLDILILPTKQNAAANQIMQWFTQNQNRWDMTHLVSLSEAAVFLHHLPELSCKYQLRKSSHWYQLALNDDLNAKQTTSYLKSIERKKEKLLRNNKVEIVQIKTHAELDSAFTDLISLHQMRWQEQGETGVFDSKLFQSFHQAIIKRFLDKGELAFYLLKIDDVSKAALYNFRIGNTEYFYQSGFDTKFKKRLSLGAQLHLHAIKNATESYAHTYDFMAGEQNSYKTLYGCKTSSLVNVTIFSNSTKGRFYWLFAMIKTTVKRLKLKWFAFSSDVTKNTSVTN